MAKEIKIKIPDFKEVINILKNKIKKYFNSLVLLFFISLASYISYLIYLFLRRRKI